jgi:putative membrane protein
MMHDWGFGWGWGGGMFFGPLFMIAVPVLTIVLIVALVRWLNGGRDTPGIRLTPTPRDILDERFAKGEIDRDDYEARRKALKS